MIKKVFILTLLLSGIYFLLIKIFPAAIVIPEAPWFKNELKVSQLKTYGNKHPQIAITGTSYSNILNLSSLGDSAINLAFGGHTSLDGIKLLKYHHIIPEKLFVEVNYAKFDTTGWVTKYISPHNLLPANDYSNRPSVYFTGKLVESINYNYVANSRGGLYVDSNYVLLSIQQIKDSASQNNFIKDLDEYVQAMKTELQFFKEEGTEIIFYLMPFHPQLCDEPFLEEIRKTYEKEFPGPGYRFLFHPDCSPYFTFDGRHLTGEEGKIFTEILLEEMKK